MLNHIDRWRGSQSMAVLLAAVSSVFFALLFWIWERDLFWMLAVILPPIWSPVIYRRFMHGDAQQVSRVAVGGLLIGLVLLLGVGLLAYAAN